MQKTQEIELLRKIENIDSLICSCVDEKKAMKKYKDGTKRKTKKIGVI